MNEAILADADFATLVYRVHQLEHDVKDLKQQVGRLVFGIVTLAISIAGSSIVFALTVLNSS